MGNETVNLCKCGHKVYAHGQGGGFCLRCDCSEFAGSDADVVAPLSVDELRVILAGTLCVCGRAKKAMNSFCQGDYWRLNPSERNRLYHPIGNGYEAAFAAAMDWLRYGPDQVAAWRERFREKTAKRGLSL